MATNRANLASDESEGRCAVIVEPLALRPKDAAAALGISERKLREIRHEIPHVYLGGVLVYPVAAIQAWLERQLTMRKRKSDDVVSDIVDWVVSEEAADD